MKLHKEEVAIIGKWIFDGTEMLADPPANRIDWLITNYLQKVSIHNDGWDILYQDPEDKRYWELTFPQSELHGGGPPCLKLILEKDAGAKYDL